MSTACRRFKEKILDSSHNVLLPTRFFVQVVMWGDSNETHPKCKIEMSSVNLGMFYHYHSTWPLVQKIPLEAMQYGMDTIPSLESTHKAQEKYSRTYSKQSLDGKLSYFYFVVDNQ